LDLGADYVATGHYCRKDTIVKNGKEIHRLLSGKDPNKDQSYFLCQLSQEQLSKTLFPVGELLKPEVRKIAKEQNLITAEKRDSQGLCFIGKVRLPDFLQQQLKPKEGIIIEVPQESPVFTEKIKGRITPYEKESEKFEYTPQDGKVVGRHQGAHFFTKGQRKGLAVGGTKEPLFIIETDVKENIVYTGQGKNHPGLFRKGLFVKQEEVHWVRPDLTLNEDETLEVVARIRYRQPLEKATLHQTINGLYVIFEKPQTAISEGQFVAWYHDDELLGSGVIS
ncbi:MAG: tRNA 2-thiouridine(34) synthase MnmA, partial [Flavobacteriaceae bacterium]|nr:tRNA 2-thiouridine(34) synthase MnmA [Flavobacteriaceae bacterium]